MTKPSEIQISCLMDLVSAWEDRGHAAEGYRAQIDREIANGSLSQIGAINLIKELRARMGK